VGHGLADAEAKDQAPPHYFAPTWPPGVTPGAPLTEDSAVSIALWNSAALRVELSRLGVSRADLAEAGALPNPALSFLFPVSTRQLELSITYPIVALFTRPSRVAAAKLDVERTARDLVRAGLDLARDVRIGHAEVLAAQAKRELRTTAVSLTSRSAEIAAARLRSGEISAFEVNLSRTEEQVAIDQERRSRHELTLAWSRLRHLLGLAESALGENLTVTEPTAAGAPRPPLERAESVALAARPEVRAAEISLEAAGRKAGLESAKMVQLMARLDAKPVGSRGGPPILWIPGFQAEVPLFNQNQAGRARAAAEISRAAWAYLATRQQVLTEVRVAHEEVVMARGSLEPWAANVVPTLEATLKSSLHQYAVGAEAYILVLEATRKLIDAQQRQVDLLLDLRRATARLDHAMGFRVDAVH
jgi:cobalt-zinc-cadmium efflux system outer membrane protein